MVEDWVKRLVESAAPHQKLVVGNRYLWRNRIVRVTGGKYWGEHGICNFWDWIDTETGETFSGYNGGEFRDEH